MKTVVVTLTDKGYFHKCKRTIVDIRSRGKWTDDLVLITVGFDAPRNFLDYYRVIQKRVEHIDTSAVLAAYKEHPIRPTCDNREFAKLTQWDKFYVFDTYFAQWDKVIYFDAGLRIFDSISYLDNLPCKGVLMAPDDAPAYDTTKRFNNIIEVDRNPEVVKELFQEYGSDILYQRYFLNCLWVYDTGILQQITMQEMVDTMNKYPICRCNEMTIMNLLVTFKHKLWKAFPEFVSHPETANGMKRLFGWTERDRNYGNTTWRDFCFLKYPSTINFDCE
jgi:hypothetical protein